ncbi:hypothetical protein [Sphingomonas sp. KC8]|uniref:hypothetical protein n=1 Tax=Sphingomonas sp. KC8 TaxID=1030157 RepID=UPI0002488EF3|nr:hypothetical protein [Sphingomonas sp. KC8]ARS27488.1 hypothetical protein KC8_09315 [Sphingomonas sp. KC8]
MAIAPSAALPGWFRAAALLAILWNGFGLAMYLSSVGTFGDPAAGLNEADRAAAASIPGWISGAFAIGTVNGLIGSFGLLARKNWAQPVLIISLAGLLTLEGWIVFFSGALASFGLAVPLMVSGGAILLAGIATIARRRGWLA